MDELLARPYECRLGIIESIHLMYTMLRYRADCRQKNVAASHRISSLVTADFAAFSDAATGINTTRLN